MAADDVYYVDVCSEDHKKGETHYYFVRLSRSDGEKLVKINHLMDVAQKLRNEILEKEDIKNPLERNERELQLENMSVKRFLEIWIRMEVKMSVDITHMDDLPKVLREHGSDPEFEILKSEERSMNELLDEHYKLKGPIEGRAEDVYYTLTAELDKFRKGDLIPVNEIQPTPPLKKRLIK